MPKGRPRKVKVLAPEGDEFVITLKIGQEIYRGSGVTAMEALENLPKPQKILLKGIVTVEKGEKKREQIMYPVRLRRLFWPIARYTQAKLLAFGFEK